MQTLTVDAVLGNKADVSACLVCRAFWFEPFETLHLTRESTLELFRLISAHDGAQGPFPGDSRCPVCNARLKLTHDRQRSTPFQYWRCEAEHGRFTSFIDFLREKEFVKPLTPQQIAELRQNIQMIRCSGCGGTVNLGHETCCPHCGAEISMLDAASLRQLAGPASPPVQEARSPHVHNDVPEIFSIQHPASAPPDMADVIVHGLQAFGRWLLDRES